jgi:WD40 repeat protein
VLAGHTLGVLDVAWSPDGTELVSGSRDYKVRRWDYATGNSSDRYSEVNCVRSVDWHPDGDYFINSGIDEVQLKLRDARTGSAIKSFTEGMGTRSDIMSSRFSPDGNKIAAGAGKEHTLRVYSVGIDTNGGDGGEDGRKAFWAVAFVIVAIVGVVIFYYPLFRRWKGGGW